MEKRTIAPSIIDFEREYFPCPKEWWCVEGFFTTVKNNKNWSFKGDFCQIITRSKSEVSIYSMKLFDLTSNKIYEYYSGNYSSKLESAKDKFHVKYDKSYLGGSFPTYQMYLNDPKNNLDLDIEYHAESLPYWVAQQVTNGWLPWGLGYYRYGFIPKNDITGTIKIDNELFSIKGKGYLEHIFGDFSFLNLKASKISTKKIISIYAKLFDWWIRNQKIEIPKSIMFCTDNRPFGYDWLWAVLDNGWSLFYGNIISWVAEGPTAGVLILSKNGTKYNEFGNIRFKYITMKYIPEYDFYYPTELEIISAKGNEKLYLHFKNTSEGFEDIGKSPNRKGIIGYVICQVPCTVEGYYFDGVEKISISGNSKMEFHRLLHVFGHNSLRFDFKLSKNCFGIMSNFDSHYFGKKIDINLKILPGPKLKINYNRINKSQLK